MTTTHLHYGQLFYASRDSRTAHSARTILTLALQLVPHAASVVDVGCGVGTWLRAAQQLGVSDIAGFDGPWVPQEKLQIPVTSFHPQDLHQRIDCARSFDLAISLEVAEHLSESHAKAFVANLTALSDVILFSAAIPNQGGEGHVNEQWPSYWAKQFCDESYVCVDGIRGAIWEDSTIPWWYRQNILMFIKASVLAGLQLPADWRAGAPRSLVHPEQLGVLVTKTRRPSEAAKLLFAALRHYAQVKTGRIKQQ